MFLCSELLGHLKVYQTTTQLDITSVNVLKIDKICGSAVKWVISSYGGLKNNMGYIYMYTSPNGKHYIGQTKQSIKERRKASKGLGYVGCPAFYHAIQKYGGLDKFQLEILEEIDNSLLNEREEYWIKFYNSLIPNGYNIKKGGETSESIQKKIVYQFNLNEDLIKEYDSLTTAAKENKVGIGSISEVCHGRKATLLNSFWSFQKDNNHFKKPKRKTVYQFSEDGTLIKEFESARNADRFYNFPPGTVK